MLAARGRSVHPGAKPRSKASSGVPLAPLGSSFGPSSDGFQIVTRPTFRQFSNQAPSRPPRPPQDEVLATVGRPAGVPAQVLQAPKSGHEL